MGVDTHDCTKCRKPCDLQSPPEKLASTPCKNKVLCGDFCEGRCRCLGCTEPMTYSCDCRKSSPEKCGCVSQNSSKPESVSRNGKNETQKCGCEGEEKPRQCKKCKWDLSICVSPQCCPHPIDWYYHKGMSSITCRMCNATVMNPEYKEGQESWTQQVLRLEAERDKYQRVLEFLLYQSGHKDGNIGEAEMKLIEKTLYPSLPPAL